MNPPTLSTEEFRERIKTLVLGPNWIRPPNPLLTREKSFPSLLQSEEDKRRQQRKAKTT